MSTSARKSKGPARGGKPFRIQRAYVPVTALAKVVDFDGEKLSEKALARKYGVRFTPTLQFFPERLAGAGKGKPQEREVARSVGYVEPQPFLRTFRFIAERVLWIKSCAPPSRADGRYMVRGFAWSIDPHHW